MAKVVTRFKWCGLVTLFATTAAIAFPDPPNDPDFYLQWGLENEGQTIANIAGQMGADVGALEAWGIHIGTRPVVVAIVGRGLDPHPEFEDRLLAGRATIGDPYDSLAVCGGDTALAGVIAASTGNGVGIAGLNSHVEVLPVRVFDGCIATANSTAEGIVWAVDQGASIVLVPVRLRDSAQVLDDAVAYAVDHNVFVVAPEGSGGLDVKVYPAAIEGCLAVAATTNADTVSPESGLSTDMDLAAPGQNVWSTVSTGGYGFLPAHRDTTLASAFVAGIASLIQSYAPEASADGMTQILLDTADDLGDPGWDPRTGFGRLNAGDALEATTPPALRFEPIDSPPTLVAPGRANSFVVRIVSVGEVLADDSVRLVYRADSPNFQWTSLRSLGEDRYLASLPAVDCDTSIDYYLTAAGKGGTNVTDPPDAPWTFWKAQAIVYHRVFTDDFENDLDWEIEGGDSLSGRWVRADPVGTSAQPEYDRSPDLGEQCFVTAQHVGTSDGSNDVDDQLVMLTSPIIQIDTADAVVSYARWFQSIGGNPDFLTIELSRDGGKAWTVVETVESSDPPEWTDHSFRLSDLPTVVGDRVRLRFSSVELIKNDSVTEAAIDDFSVDEIRCTLPPGDVDGDGATDAVDYREFMNCLTGPAGVLDRGVCTVLDFDDSLVIDLLDLQYFQIAFAPR